MRTAPECEMVELSHEIQPVCNVYRKADPHVMEQGTLNITGVNGAVVAVRAENLKLPFGEWNCHRFQVQ